MGVNLSIKQVPEQLAQRLRERAARNHRSLQGELMSIIEQAASPLEAEVEAVAPGPVRRVLVAGARRPVDDLLARIDSELGTRGLAGAPWLSREAVHDRVALRETPPRGPAKPVRAAAPIRSRPAARRAAR